MSPPRLSQLLQGGPTIRQRLIPGGVLPRRVRQADESCGNSRTIDGSRSRPADSRRCKASNSISPANTPRLRRHEAPDGERRRSRDFQFREEPRQVLALSRPTSCPGLIRADNKSVAVELGDIPPISAPPHPRPAHGRHPRHQRTSTTCGTNPHHHRLHQLVGRSRIQSAPIHATSPRHRPRLPVRTAHHHILGAGIIAGWNTNKNTASQLAASITFLLSEDGTNISGAVLPSDGAWSVQ